uniref:Palmitoyltransferase n=2 Tax=Macrostomum lignano TaxID=282301 RepID=A0A1I8HF81_9PLAT
MALPGGGQLTERSSMVAVSLEDNGVDQSAVSMGASGSGGISQYPGAPKVAKIVVKTVSGRRGQDPVKPPKKLAVFRCNWLCGLFGVRQFPPRGCWLVMDVCGVFCAIFTWLLLVFAEYVACTVILANSESAVFNWIAGAIFHSLIGLSFWSHCKAMFSDPGAVPLGNATEENIRSLGCGSEGADRIVYKCGKCSSIKPDRSHHCSVCRRCIRKMDHHCPWVNNCVGECNQKYFVLFTLYICAVSCFAIFMTVHHFVKCSDWDICRPTLTQPLPIVLLVLLIFESIMFGLFTAIMFGDQIHSILKDQTGIETLKRERHSWKRQSRMSLLEGVFGQPISWRWLSPFSPPSFTKSAPQRLCLYSV